MPISSVARLPLWLWAAWGVALVVLILRAGLYPAAVTGDEIWFTESAYQFLQTGTPKRLIHADGVGSVTADFLPPIIMLLQTASLWVGGLTAGAVGAPSVLLMMLGSILVYGVARRAGATPSTAGLAALTVFGAQTILRGALYVRYEGAVLVAFFGFLALVPVAGRAAAIGRGALVGIAGLAYYPTAPFVGLAALLIETGVLRLFPIAPSRRAIPWTAFGFALAIAPFLLYVGRYPAEFAAQVLNNGAAHYGTAELLSRFADLSFWQGQRETLPESVALLAVLLLAFVRGEARAWAWVILLLTLPALLYPFNPRLLGLSVALALCLAAVWASRAGWMKPLARFGLAGGTLAATAMLGLMGSVGLVQAEGRDGAALGPLLKPYLTHSGPIAADQRAWLALRRDFPERVFLHALPSWSPPQVSVFEPSALRDPNFRVTYALVQTDIAEATLARAPALAAGRAEGSLVPLARFTLPIRPLPLAKAVPFDLTLYGPRP
ncbi:MAG: hypothetical protein ACOVKO_01710 [Elstera sp.]